MAVASAQRAGSLAALLAAQNPDGGWSYGQKASWTEPTVYALLALVAADEEHSEPARRAGRWLRKLQRDDGGLASSSMTHESSWVTGVALLLAGRSVALFDTGAAMEWVLTAVIGPSTSVERIRVGLFGRRARPMKPDGWSWTPDTYPWVFPTSMTILGLQRAGRIHPDGRIAARVRDGRDYLRRRLCSGGGWNIGDGPTPYPETTGAGLLAMRGAAGVDLRPTLAAAEEMCSTCRSREAALWLALGLAAHGRPAAIPAAAGVPRGTRELALSLIAEAQLAGGHSLLGG